MMIIITYFKKPKKDRFLVRRVRLRELDHDQYWGARSWYVSLCSTCMSGSEHDAQMNAVGSSEARCIASRSSAPPAVA